MIGEEKIKDVFAKAEKAFKVCWGNLTDMRDAKSLFSFQPTLITALYQIELVYQELCKEQRELNRQKPKPNSKQFSERTKTLDRYKNLLDQLIDTGKVLGDAFAWLFYQKEKQLLKNHYDHEFIPHLPTGTGGLGELEFVRNAPRFGQHLVLAHSITTFLRHGDVSLIDRKDLKVVAIGELKTKRKTDTEISVRIVIAGTKLPKEMLPKIPAQQKEIVPATPEDFPPQILARLKKQVQKIHESFKPPPQSHAAETLEMTLANSKLKELFDKSSTGTWGIERIGRGLLLLGIKFEEMPLYEQLNGEAPEDYTKNHEPNLERMKMATMDIVDKKLPDNSIKMVWIPYAAHDRYSLPFGMRPFFWWPLDATVRKAMIFHQMRVMTVYNPAFLLDDLRRAGLDIQSDKLGRLKVSKKYGDGRIEFLGIDYFLNIVRTQFVSDASMVNIIRWSVERVEREGFTQPTRVSLDFDFNFD